MGKTILTLPLRAESAAWNPIVSLWFVHELGNCCIFLNVSGQEGGPPPDPPPPSPKKRGDAPLMLLEVGASPLSLMWNPARGYAFYGRPPPHIKELLWMWGGRAPAEM